MSIFKEYLIIRCTHCGLPQYVLSHQKSRKCPNCKKQINIRKAIKLYKTNDLQKAIRIVQELKLKVNAERDKRKRVISIDKSFFDDEEEGKKEKEGEEKIEGEETIKKGINKQEGTSGDKNIEKRKKSKFKSAYKELEEKSLKK